jgi:hypothetical protein
MITGMRSVDMLIINRKWPIVLSKTTPNQHFAIVISILSFVIEMLELPPFLFSSFTLF